ncbi:AraC family transcriptional regulator [Oleiphilus messinensis]|uniref:AraC family transcriptional regulator n=1 Tax=Oleiphilus messinensis TaxID=141451 RepID=A0A1Y0IBJ5_9GAMM|nr:AraC family transcriptional regulator [Oleiphilus messinensis]ARU56763.1 AraC family transcriptional regulator [Oleiphilus messinensis]
MSKNDPYDLSRPSLPATYAKVLLDVLSERGIDSAPLIRNAALPTVALTRTDSRINLFQWSKLVLEALNAAEDDGIGYEYGLALPPTAHGMLVFAAMSAPTLGAALDLASTFFGMRLQSFRLEVQKNQIDVQTNQNVAIIKIAETHPIFRASPRDAQRLRRFFYETLMLTVVKVADGLTGNKIGPQVLIHVDWPEPEYHGKYCDRLPDIRFDQVTNQIMLPDALLTLPLPAANETAYQQALAYCEQEKARFCRDVEDITERVKATLILTPYSGYPKIDAVASRLNLSSRTLKRRLQEVGSSFLRVLEAVQQREAESLLTNTDMQIQEIANFLGYKGAANFTRAFNRWSGETPGQYRKKAKQ